MSIHSALARPAASRNEPVRDYAPHSPERAQVEQELRRLSASRQELPLLIGGRTVTTGRLEPAVIPHDVPFETSGTVG